MGWSNEFKVGLFVLIGGALVLGGIFWSIDGLRPGEDTYDLFLAVPSAEGLYPGSGVKLAGVDIGQIDELSIAPGGESAVLTLAIRAGVELPVDSTADIRSSGFIGDRFIAVYPGEADLLLAHGDWIRLRRQPADIERITQQVEDISEDVKAITGALRQMVEEDRNRENIEATLENVRMLSEDLRGLAERNERDIDAIVDNVRRLTETLDAFARETQADVDEELEQLKETTATLDRAINDIASITGKIDEGEGTIGALVNDRETVDLLNETIANANSVIEGFSGLHSEVYYIGRFYAGTTPPEDPFFFGNPLAGAGSNTIGIMLQPQEDFWYSFEINDYPLGVVNYAEHFYPESGLVYTEWTRTPDYRMSFMMNKRWRDFALRLGVKEGGGGVGASFWLFEDHLELQGDVFDFDLGAYPAIQPGQARGIPNSRFLARYNGEHVFFELGAEQVFLGLRYGYITGFAGAGFHFSDDDIKLLFATLPLDF